MKGLLARLFCRLFFCPYRGHWWYESHVFECSDHTYDSEFTCRRCGIKNRGRITNPQ